MINNCLSCKKREEDKKKNAVCVTIDGKEHLILERSLYDGEGDYRKALSECGVNCDKYVLRVKQKVEKKKAEPKKVVSKPLESIDATEPQAEDGSKKKGKSQRSFRELAGYAIAGAEGAFIASILVLIALGAL